MGNIAYLRGNFEKALQKYNRALSWNVNAPYKAYLNRALTYERLGDIDAARKNYQQALSDNPSLDVARDQLLDILAANPTAKLTNGKIKRVGITDSRSIASL